MGKDGGTGNEDLNTGEPEIEGGDRTATGAPKVNGRWTTAGANKSLPRYATALKERAKLLYFNYTQRHAIAKDVGIPIKTLESWIQKGKWYKQREVQNKDVAAEVLRRKGFLTANITNLSFEALSKAIAGVAVKKEVTLQEGYMISSILSQLDKVVRLAQGEPTDVVEHKGQVGLKAIAFKTEKEIRAALKADPMTNLMKEAIPVHAGKIGELEGAQAVKRAVDKVLADEVIEMVKDTKKPDGQ